MDVENWREKARQLNTEIVALCLAYRDPRIPWYAKIFMAGLVAYALSPVDLIPDFIPVLGLVDDVLLLPVGLSLLMKMIPGEVLEEYRGRAVSELDGPGLSKWVVSGVIVLIWLFFICLIVRFFR